MRRAGTLMSAHVQHLADRTADGALAVSAIATGVSLAATLQVVQIVAGCVAILSGICASYYYIRKAHTK